MSDCVVQPCDTARTSTTIANWCTMRSTPGTWEAYCATTQSNAVVSIRFKTDLGHAWAMKHQRNEVRSYQMTGRTFWLLNTRLRTPDVTYTYAWREEVQGSKQNSEALFKETSRTESNISNFRCKPSLSWSNYIKLQSPMWVSCSRTIARVQQRLVVNLVVVPCTSTKRWSTQEDYPRGRYSASIASSRVMLIESFRER